MIGINEIVDSQLEVRGCVGDTGRDEHRGEASNDSSEGETNITCGHKYILRPIFNLHIDSADQNKLQGRLDMI